MAKSEREFWLHITDIGELFLFKQSFRGLVVKCYYRVTHKNCMS